RGDSPLANPRTEYGWSKVETERELRALQRERVPITIVYPGGVIGPDQPTLDATLEGIVGARTMGWPRTSGGVSLIDVLDLAMALAAAVQPGRAATRLMPGGRFFPWDRLGAPCDCTPGSRARRRALPSPGLLATGTPP